jgi:hypothetical protein
MHVLEYLYSAQASFFSLCQLGWYYGVPTMLLIHPQISPAKAIKLCKVAIGLQLQQLSKE